MRDIWLGHRPALHALFLPNYCWCRRATPRKGGTGSELDYGTDAIDDDDDEEEEEDDDESSEGLSI